MLSVQKISCISSIKVSVDDFLPNKCFSAIFSCILFLETENRKSFVRMNLSEFLNHFQPTLSTAAFQTRSQTTTSYLKRIIKNNIFKNGSGIGNSMKRTNHEYTQDWFLSWKINPKNLRKFQLHFFHQSLIRWIHTCKNVLDCQKLRLVPRNRNLILVTLPIIAYPRDSSW